MSLTAISGDLNLFKVSCKCYFLISPAAVKGFVSTKTKGILGLS